MSPEARQNAVSYPRQRVRLPYPRSKSGCLVCRRLHKKCDERRPMCTRCLLKGKACQWPRAQRDRDRGPDDDNVPSFHDITPPVQDSVNNSRSYENDTSSPLSTFGGNSRPGDKDLRLIAPPSCSMGNVSSMFLAHFVAETSRYMTTVSPEKNPFLTHLLPLALSNELILHALLALGGAHLERKQSSSEISTWACRHHGHVIYLLKDAISQESIEPLEWVQILLVQLILYLIGVFGPAEDEGAIMHIRAGRKIARGLLGATLQTNSTQVLCDFTLELYTYLALVASPTPYSNGTGSELDTRSSILLPRETLKGYENNGVIVSPIYQSLEIIPRVTSLCTCRQAESMFQECSPENWAEFVQLLSAIESIGNFDDLTEPAANLEQGENLSVSIIYRHALAIFAYDAMWCGNIVEDESGLSVVRGHALSALMLIPTVLDTHLRNVLLWPTIVIGSCLLDEKERDVIRKALSIREPLFVVMKMRMMLENLWAENDPIYFGPYGLHKHMLSQKNVIYLA